MNFPPRSSALASVLLLSITGGVLWWSRSHMAPAPRAVPSSASPMIPKPGDEPLQFLAALPGLPGALAYLSVVPPQSKVPQAVPYNLIVRPVRQSAPQVLEERNQVMPGYARVVFDPQFMPDGKNVLLKLGWPYDDGGAYTIRLWNRGSRQLGPSLVQGGGHPKVSISPDGRQLLSVLPNGLSIIDIGTRKSRLIVRTPTQASFTFAQTWTTRGTVLYLALPKNAPLDSTRPSIFEVSTQGATPREIIPDAYCVTERYPFHPRPAPSPDGRWIAFIGRLPHQKEVPNEYGEVDVKLGLYLFDRRTRKRTLVKGARPAGEDFARWTPDSKRLLILTEAWKEKQNGMQARIDSIAIPTLAITPIATIQARDTRKADFPRSSNAPQFEMMKVTRSGKHLLVKANEYTDLKGQFYVVSNSIHAVDLQASSASLLARTQSFKGSSMGLDWLDESKP